MIPNQETFTPALRVSRLSNGLEWGACPTALLVSDAAALLIVPGHTVYLNRIAGSGYEPRKLVIHHRHSGRVQTLIRGVRFSLQDVCAKSEAINAVFGDGATDLIENGTTAALGYDDWLEPMTPLEIKSEFARISRRRERQRADAESRRAIKKRFLEP